MGLRSYNFVLIVLGNQLFVSMLLIRKRSIASHPKVAQPALEYFLRKLLRGLQYVPRVIVTDKLRSYGSAKREILPGVEHRQSR